MSDWRAEIRKRLASAKLERTRETEIVEEIVHRADRGSKIEDRGSILNPPSSILHPQESLEVAHA